MNKLELGLEIINFFKHAELMGSRFWQVDPTPNADWDWVVYTDDPELRLRFCRMFSELGTMQADGADIWIRLSGDTDLHVHPVAKREPTLKAYEHRKKTGCSKHEMVEYLYSIYEQDHEKRRANATAAGDSNE